MADRAYPPAMKNPPQKSPGNTRCRPVLPYPIVLDKRPESCIYQAVKITANMVTIARIVLMPLPGWLLYQGLPHLYFAIGLIILIAVTDWLDGAMARKEGPTVLGGLLDPIADKIFVAVCFIPLAERPVPGQSGTVFALWMVILMFCRDFLVTSLRTSLSMRDAPMRTSVLAKFKTAIQMAAACYLLAALIGQMADPEGWTVNIVMAVAAAIPTTWVLTRLIQGRTPGKRSITMAALTSLYVAVQILFGPAVAMPLLVYGVVAITVVSGFSYLVDAWSAIKGRPGGVREAFRFILEGLLVPTALLLPLGRFETTGMSALIILAITLELATGGLANLLASKKVLMRFRLVALKSILEVLFAGAAVVIHEFDLLPGWFAGELCIAAAAAVALVHAAASFIRHRRIYLDQL